MATSQEMWRCLSGQGIPGMCVSGERGPGEREEGAWDVRESGRVAKGAPPAQPHKPELEASVVSDQDESRREDGCREGPARPGWPRRSRSVHIRSRNLTPTKA